MDGANLKAGACVNCHSHSSMGCTGFVHRQPAGAHHSRSYHLLNYLFSVA